MQVGDAVDVPNAAVGVDQEDSQDMGDAAEFRTVLCKLRNERLSVVGQDRPQVCIRGRRQELPIHPVPRMPHVMGSVLAHDGRRITCRIETQTEQTQSIGEFLILLHSIRNLVQYGGRERATIHIAATRVHQTQNGDLAAEDFMEGCGRSVGGQQRTVCSVSQRREVVGSGLRHLESERTVTGRQENLIVGFRRVIFPLSTTRDDERAETDCDHGRARPFREHGPSSDHSPRHPPPIEDAIRGLQPPNHFRPSASIRRAHRPRNASGGVAPASPS